MTLYRTTLMDITKEFSEMQLQQLDFHETIFKMINGYQ